MTDEDEAGKDGARPPGARCPGGSRGKPCKNLPKFPFGAPRWCFNCDPSLEGVQRRKDAGRIRHNRKADLAKFEGANAPPAPDAPTLSYVVDLALATARRVANGDIEAKAGSATASLLGRAIDAMTAQGHVGDAQTTPRASLAPAAPDAPPPPTGTPMEELSRQLLDA